MMADVKERWRKFTVLNKPQRNDQPLMNFKFILAAVQGVGHPDLINLWV